MVWKVSYQYDEYLSARQDEHKFESKSKGGGLFGYQVSVYKAYSRQICNYVFPKNIKRRNKTVKTEDLKDNEGMAVKALHKLAISNVSTELIRV